MIRPITNSVLRYGKGSGGVQQRVALMLAAVVLMLALSPACFAEFYSWTDAAGRRHISSIPPQGVSADGRIKPGHHPYSIQQQYARMLRKIERDGQLMAAQQAEQEAAAAAAENADTEASFSEQILDFFSPARAPIEINN